jgi:hypothetical protein
MESTEGVEVKLARIEVHLTQLSEQLTLMTGLLVGANGSPGIVVRLDRLEQSEGRRTKLVWLALGAAGSALAKMVIG